MPSLRRASPTRSPSRYLVLQQAAKQDQTRTAGVWLSGEIESLRKKVAEAEAKVEQYRSKTNLFIGTNNTSLSNQQLGEYNAQLGSARAQKSDAEAKARLIREALKSGGPVEFSDIVNSELMRRLSEQRVTLRAQLAEQSSTLLGQHPRIKELRAQITDLERQMRGEADRLARSLENDAKLASAKVDGLSSGFDQLKRQAASTNEQDVQLRALERDAKSQRDLLESYLAKYREATARDSIGAVSAPTPASSRLPSCRTRRPGRESCRSSWSPALADVRAILGLCAEQRTAWARCRRRLAFSRAGLCRACFRRCERRRRCRMSSCRRNRGRSSRKPTRSRRRRLKPCRSSTSRSKRTRSIRLPAISAQPATSARRITVVGASRNVGATMAAIALARSLAKQGRVVLIDLALGAPNLSAIASDPTAPGIAELVRGSASFGQIITRDRHSRVHLIMAGQADVDARAIMASQRLAITLEALGRSYDHVVIDAGTVTDAVLDRLASLPQRVLLVAGEVDDPATVAAEESLLEAGFADCHRADGVPQAPDSAGDQVAA